MISDLAFLTYSQKQGGRKYIIHIPLKYRIFSLLGLITAISAQAFFNESRIIRDGAFGMMILFLVLLLVTGLETHIEISTEEQNLDQLRSTVKLYLIKVSVLSEINTTNIDGIIIDREPSIRAGRLGIPVFYRLKVRGDAQDQVIGTASPTTCFQLGLDLRMRFDCKLTVTYTSQPLTLDEEITGMYIETDRQKLREKQNWTTLTTVPGKILSHGSTTEISLNDRRYAETIFYSIFLLLFAMMGFLFIFSDPNSNQTDKIGVIALLIFLSIIVVYHLVKGTKRTFIRISPDSLEVGYDLLGLVSTRSLPFDQLWYIADTKKLKGYLSLLFISKKQLVIAGRFNTPKNAKITRNYLVHKITDTINRD